MLRDEAAMAAIFSRIPHGSGENLPKNEKAPRDARGLPASPFLAKGVGLCAKGGWPGLRLLEPITVAGPRPIRTAFPASPAANLKIQFKPRARECQCRCWLLVTPESEKASAVFPIGLALFDQCAQTFL
jgi:hypothetical protein